MGRNQAKKVYYTMTMNIWRRNISPGEMEIKQTFKGVKMSVPVKNTFNPNLSQPDWFDFRSTSLLAVFVFVNKRNRCDHLMTVELPQRCQILICTLLRWAQPNTISAIVPKSMLRYVGPVLPFFISQIIGIHSLLQVKFTIIKYSKFHWPENHVI